MRGALLYPFAAFQMLFGFMLIVAVYFLVVVAFLVALPLLIAWLFIHSMSSRKTRVFVSESSGGLSDDFLAAQQLCPYSVLGISKGASVSECQTAYRALVKQWHPDTVRDEEARREASERMQEINWAYKEIQLSVD